MKKEKFLLLLVVFMLISPSGWSKDKWKKIDNKLYSFSLPAHWKPEKGMQGDGCTPMERDAGIHIYYLTWGTPFIKTQGKIPETILISIQSYQRTDQGILTIEDVENLETKLIMTLIPIQKTEIWPKSGQRRFFIIKESKEMDGSIVRYRYYYLLKKSGDIVHCVKIMLQDSMVKDLTVQQTIKDILNSFKVKE